MKPYRTLPLAVLALALVTACGGNDKPAPASVRIISGDLTDEGLLLYKDSGSLISLAAADADGNDIDVEGSVTWTSDDPETVSVDSLGTSAIATGIDDWFDASQGTSIAEDEDPATTITAEYGGLTASVTAKVLLDVGDTWTVTVGQEAPQLVPFLQDGRTISQPLAGMEGVLNGVTLSMTTPDLTLEGTFSSRDKVEGTGVDSAGVSYQWSAER